MKCILRSCVSLTIIYVLIIAIIAIPMWFLANSSSLEEEAQDVDTKPNQSCPIPSNYCDYSTKALEQELKQAHKINDKYIELMGKEKVELINTLELCENELELYEQNRKETMNALEECAEIVQINMGRIHECSQILNKCNKNLEGCIIMSREYCGSVLP